LLGKRKREARADLEEAKQLAREACLKIANGEQRVLELKNAERDCYERARTALPPGTALDVACREYGTLLEILGGKVTPVEACRDYVKRHSVVLPRISVPDAVAEITKAAKADGKSRRRQQQLEAVLTRLTKSFSTDVHTLTPKTVSDYLTALPFRE